MVVSDLTGPLTRHELKTWPGYYEAVECGEKTFELRRNDRDFETGDVLVLREWDPEHGYTGRSLERLVTYVLRNAEAFGLRSGFVVLGLSAARWVEDGVSAGSTATAGAQVAREQTTVHAEHSVTDFDRIRRDGYSAGFEAGHKVALPDPDRREDECGVTAGYWHLTHPGSGSQCTDVMSYAIDGEPWVYTGPGPDFAYTVAAMRERCLAGLAACEDAERLAAEQRASSVGVGHTEQSEGGDTHG